MIPSVDAIVNETFHYSPITPLGVPHVTRADNVYEGHFIPKGTMVFGNLWALLREEEIYGPNVDEFIPERFLNQDGQMDSTKNYYLYDTAFGWGRRICPGKAMLWLTAASLLATFDITNPVDADRKPINPVRINDKYTQWPVRPVFILIRSERRLFADARSEQHAVLFHRYCETSVRSGRIFDS
ncbi:cytochrome P450 [Dendrothele bispora CBS 962.96]|uniref:Cytochrome P450 n=1 Tax=Dendrothele bispora (strain CBS 962.96) TaxID=1314807 RepID=A0A4S8M104_DENBC|nr:cytochrome P450 [Dendrothele bispora CBS 962.96]